jgi:hypothetical protein
MNIATKNSEGNSCVLFSFYINFFQIPRNPNVNRNYYKWNNESMRKAIIAVMDGSLSIRGASQLFCMPFTTLQNKVTDAKFFSAGLCTRMKDVSGHPRVLYSDQETVLVNRLLHLKRIGLGQTVDQVRRAAYSLAEAKSLKHPWDGEKKISGVDWFHALRKGVQI